MHTLWNCRKYTNYRKPLRRDPRRLPRHPTSPLAQRWQSWVTFCSSYLYCYKTLHFQSKHCQQKLSLRQLMQICWCPCRRERLHHPFCTCHFFTSSSSWFLQSRQNIQYADSPHKISVPKIKCQNIVMGAHWQSVLLVTKITTTHSSDLLILNWYKTFDSSHFEGTLLKQLGETGMFLPFRLDSG